MTGIRPLVARYLARLASQRLLVVAIVLAVLALALGWALVARAVAVRGGTEIEQASSVRALGWNRGSALFEQCVLVLAIVLGATQITSDARAGTLFTILARPVSRPMVFFAGWCASALLLCVLELMRAVTWVGAAHLAGAEPDSRLLAGIAGLVARDWLLLAMFAAFGARLMPAYTVAAGVGLLVIGGIGFREGIDGTAGFLANGLASVVPLYGRQDVIVRSLVGEPVGLTIVGEAILYQLVWTALLVYLGAWAFSRRDLAPRP